LEFGKKGNVSHAAFKSKNILIRLFPETYFLDFEVYIDHKVFALFVLSY